MDYTLRATRFPLKLPLRYRESGTIPWHNGHTENISRTGILFRAEQDVPVQTALEMRIEFPSFLNLALVCRGPVVREQASASPETHALLAAAIRACRFLPKRSIKNPK
jgi:hypothetical protein